MLEIKKILYPTDFSDNADHARGYVVEMAKKFGAEVELVHVAPVPGDAIGYEIGSTIRAVDDQITEAAERSIQEVADKIRAEGIAVTAVVDRGPPFVEIIRRAADREADLIIMATHGRGAVAHLLMGSTAEKVVRDARCPVLTVRNPEHEFVHP